MANLRIKDITATATTYAALEYVAIDSIANDVQKITLDNVEAQIRNGASDAQMGYVAGLTATDTELNILDGCTATYEELNYLAGLTPGASSASKAVVLSAAQNGAIGNNLTVGGTIAVTGDTTLTGAVSCVSSLTMDGSGAIDLKGNDLILDADGDSKLYEKVDDVVSLNLGGSEEYRFGATAFGCVTSGANSLGGALNVGTENAPYPWKNLNIVGNIFMGATADPTATTTNESLVIWMDSTSGDIMARVQHGGSERIKTISAF